MTDKAGKVPEESANINLDGMVYIADTVIGTPGNDHLRGSTGDDVIDASQGGNDVVDGRSGDDEIYFGAAFTGADKVTGNDGHDVVTLDGDYSTGIEMQADSLYKIERLVLLGGSYRITGELGYQDKASHHTVVDASGLAEGQSLNLDVSIAGQTLFVDGGDGNDTIHASTNGVFNDLSGNGGNDTLIGGTGQTKMEGGSGSDTIIMSTSADFAFYGPDDVHAHKWVDTIENFSASGGRISLDFDSDETTAGTQHAFHLGKTADRVGDIRSHYDAASDETIVKVFTNTDHQADLVIHLSGDVSLTTADFIFG